MRNDGGSAFPRLEELGDIYYASQGMTLRDAFALAALPATHQLANTSLSRAYMAQLAYEIADAMLAERKKR